MNDKNNELSAKIKWKYSKYGMFKDNMALKMDKLDKVIF